MLHLPICLTFSYLDIMQGQMYCVLLTIFRTNPSPYVLIVFGKDDGHADEEPKDKEKRKVISVLLKWQH
jgi:hypothetical protein